MEYSSKNGRKGARDSNSSAPTVKSTASSDTTIASNEEREAAEILLGLRRSTQMEPPPPPIRKSVITDARSLANPKNTPNIPSKKDTASAVNMSTRPPISIEPSTSGTGHSYNSCSGGSVNFCRIQHPQKNKTDIMMEMNPISKGMFFLAPQPHQSIPINLSTDRQYSVISTHPATTPTSSGARGDILDASNIPISVVKRQDTVTIRGRKSKNATANVKTYPPLQLPEFKVPLSPKPKSSSSSKSQFGKALLARRDVPFDPSIGNCNLSSFGHMSLSAAAGSASRSAHWPSIPIFPYPQNFQQRANFQSAERPVIIRSRPGSQIYRQRSIASATITRSQNFDPFNSAEGIYRPVNSALSNINQSNFYIPPLGPASLIQLSPAPAPAIPTIPIPSSVIVPTGHQQNQNQRDSSREDSNSKTNEQKMEDENKVWAIKSRPPRCRDALKQITVDNIPISTQEWAKAYLQTDTCQCAGVLFKAFFSPAEIQNCTIRGRNGTSLLDVKKRAAIIRAVGWMKNKEQNRNPYGFDENNLKKSDYLTQEEIIFLERKVFVERRYQTSRKIRNPSRKNVLKTKADSSSALLKAVLTKTISNSAVQNPQEVSSLTPQPESQDGENQTETSVTEPQTVIEPMDVLELIQPAEDFSVPTTSTTEAKEKSGESKESEEEEQNDQKSQQEQMEMNKEGEISSTVNIDDKS